MSHHGSKRQARLIRDTLIRTALSAAVMVGLVLMQPSSMSSKEKDDDENGAKSQLSTRSSPIAITSDNKFVWSVNPDNNSVSVFEVAGDANEKVAEIPVGTEPWCVAITPPEKERHDNAGRARDETMTSRSMSRTWSAARSRSSTPRGKKWSRPSRSEPSRSAVR